MRASTQHRARTSLYAQRRALPLLSLLACAGEAGEELGPRSGPEPSNELAALLPVPEAEPAPHDPGAVHTVPAPGASTRGAEEGEGASPAETDPTSAPSDAMQPDDVEIGLDRHEEGDGADAAEGEAEQADAEQPEAEQPEAEQPASESPHAGQPDAVPPVTEPPVTEPPVTEPPVTEPPVTEPPIGDEPPPSDDSPDGDEEAEEPGDEESDDEEEEEPPLQAAFHLAIIGSSTAEGEGASRSDLAWVELLTSSLSGVSTFSVSNFAVGGYTSVELLPASRKSGNIEEAILAQPDLIVVALAGSNDLSAGTSTATFLERLTTLRDTARAAGIPTFFMSTAPKDISAPERESLASWAQAMQSSFQSCWVPGGDAEHEPCFIDIFSALASSSLGLLPEYSSGDGIHVNDAGHAAVFRQAEPVLRPYVCSVTSCR